MMNRLMRLAFFGVVLISVASLQAQDSEEGESEMADIWTAAESGDISALQEAVKAGADVNTGRDAEDQSLPLSLATRHRHVEAVKWLLENDANVNGQDGDGSTAAMAAAFFGYPDVFEILVEAGADLSMTNYPGLDSGTVMQLDWGITSAIANDLLGLGLTEAEVTEGRTAILGLMAEVDIGAAMVTGNLEAISSHIEAGLDVNEGIGDISLLLIATIQNRSDIVDVLLKAGAKVDAQNQMSGATALVAAAFLGFNDVAEILINAGADPSITDYQGSNAMSMLDLDYESSQYIASMIEIELASEEELTKGREAIRALLEEEAEEASDTESD
ncbi:MAG: ankyrin repeat domain-containing protein [Gammaproteobacteria bacterium]|nr:ankyrin repeat domain-containing protein [Gammaproteobacteria bacterium]